MVPENTNKLAVHSQILKNQPNSYWKDITAEQIEAYTVFWYMSKQMT
jgi:hypothetical protein